MLEIHPTLRLRGKMNDPFGMNGPDGTAPPAGFTQGTPSKPGPAENKTVEEAKRLAALLLIVVRRARTIPPRNAQVSAQTVVPGNS
jgi:hypothetical protein